MLDSFKPYHPQVLATNGALVDEQIAPLLETLWAAGIRTEYSCQNSYLARGEVGEAYILFSDEAGAERFFASCERAILGGIDGRTVDFSSSEIPALTREWVGRLWGAAMGKAPDS